MRKDIFKQKKSGPREVNFIWPLAGGYLIYLGGKLLWMCWRGQGSNPVLSVLAGIVFMVAGGLIIRREWNIYNNGMQPDESSEEAEETAGELPEPEDEEAQQ